MRKNSLAGKTWQPGVENTVTKSLGNLDLRLAMSKKLMRGKKRLDFVRKSTIAKIP